MRGGDLIINKMPFQIITNFAHVDAGIGVRRGVSKGVEDGRRPDALWAATPETAARPFEGWPASSA
jgi:hypothetical protein